jgi:alkylhydroperoxidase family enzyme
MARISGVENLSPEVQTILAYRMNRDGDVKALYRILANQPDVLKVFCGYSDVLNRGGRLPADLREVAILRTAYRTGAQYEAFYHLARARSAGVREDELDQMDKSNPRGLRPEYALVIQACDELCDGDMIDPGTLASLGVGGMTPDLIVEIILLIGFYRMLAGLVNSADLDVELKGV